MYTNNYSIIERSDKVIAKIKWCSLYASQCRIKMAMLNELKLED